MTHICGAAPLIAVIRICAATLMPHPVRTLEIGAVLLAKANIDRRPLNAALPHRCTAARSVH